MKKIIFAALCLLSLISCDKEKKPQYLAVSVDNCKFPVQNYSTILYSTGDSVMLIATESGFQLCGTVAQDAIKAEVVETREEE